MEFKPSPTSARSCRKMPDLAILKKILKGSVFGSGGGRGSILLFVTVEMM